MSKLKILDPVALSLVFDTEIYILKTDTFSAKQEPVLNQVPKVLIVEAEEKIGYNYLGNNNKSILILINDAEADVIKKDDLDFLLKILKVKELTLEDIAILNITKNTAVNFDSLKSYFGFNKVIMFGVDPKTIAFQNISPNTISTYKDIPVFASWHLNLIRLDKEKKGKIMWKALKEL